MSMIRDTQKGLTQIWNKVYQLHEKKNVFFFKPMWTLPDKIVERPKQLVFFRHPLTLFFEQGRTDETSLTLLLVKFKSRKRTLDQLALNKKKTVPNRRFTKNGQLEKRISCSTLNKGVQSGYVTCHTSRLPHSSASTGARKKHLRMLSCREFLNSRQ